MKELYRLLALLCFLPVVSDFFAAFLPAYDSLSLPLYLLLVTAPALTLLPQPPTQPPGP
jgi:hypothetical protein